MSDTEPPDDALRWYAKPADDSTRPLAAERDEPIYLAMPEWKLALLSLCTGSLYQTYWAFRNWQMIADRAGRSRYLGPAIRALFAPLFSFALFSHIRSSAWGASVGRLSVAPLAITWIFLSATGSLPHPLWLLNYASVVPLLFVQRTVNRLNAALHPEAGMNDGFLPVELVVIAVGVALTAVTFWSQFAPDAYAQWLQDV